MHLYHKQSINDGDKKEKDGCFPIKCECLGVVMSNDLILEIVDVKYNIVRDGV